MADVFSNHVCWRSARLAPVLQLEALQSRLPDFFATHHPCRMRRITNLQRPNDGPVITEEEFLAAFLDPSLAHQLAFVIGSVGSGKSHLVGWLRSRIPSTDKRLVILIPKARVNLKQVLRLILADVQGPQFDEYRARLNNAVGSVDVPTAKLMLLDAIALAVSEQGPLAADPSQDPPLQVASREDLMIGLYALFHDLRFRARMTEPGGILDRLAEHIAGDDQRIVAGEDEAEDGARRFEAQEPFRFQPADLRLDFGFSGAGTHESVQEFLTLCDLDSAVRDDAVAWINNCLDSALQSVLKLSGDDLIGWMVEVRKALALAGQELVILIEDFARTQGLDTALLEALLHQPQQNDEQLCTLRSVVAVTQGFLERQRDTVRDRAQLVVNLDLRSASGESQSKDQEIARFAARYLNAVRLGEAAIVEWYGDGTPRSPEPASACLECCHKSRCHRIFGQVNDVGLYPFNRMALTRMFERPERQALTFNPRRLVKHVLEYVLANNRSHLANGEFPSEALTRFYGGTHLSAKTADQLAATFGASRSRIEGLLEFWAPSGQLTEVQAIAAAFGLAEAPESEEEPPPTHVESPEPESVPAVTTELHPRVRTALADLESWRNGAVLSSRVYADPPCHMQDKVFTALCEHIDWSEAGLLRGASAVVPGAPFHHLSVIFRNMETKPRSRDVQLLLPLREDDGVWITTVRALQGLLLHEQYGHWHFADGGAHLVALGECLHDWELEVLRQLRAGADRQTPVDPLPAAVQLLRVVSRLSGTWPADNQRVEARLEALLRPSASADEEPHRRRCKAWRDLLDKCDPKRTSAVRDLVRSFAVRPKGVATTSRLWDGALLARVLDALPDDPFALPILPEQLPSRYRDALRPLLEPLGSRLQDAVAQEAERQLQWHSQLAEALGDTTLGEAVDSVTELLRATHDAGIPVNSEALQASLQRIARRRGAAQAARETVARLADADAGQQMRLLGSLDVLEPIDVSRDFVAVAAAYAAKVAQRVGEADAASNARLAEAARCREQLGAQLVEAEQLFSQLIGEEGIDAD